jgi:hypothetical protein
MTTVSCKPMCGRRRPLGTDERRICAESDTDLDSARQFTSTASARRIFFGDTSRRLGAEPVSGGGGSDVRIRRADGKRFLFVMFRRSRANLYKINGLK